MYINKFWKLSCNASIHFNNLVTFNLLIHYVRNKYMTLTFNIFIDLIQVRYMNLNDYFFSF